MSIRGKAIAAHRLDCPSFLSRNSPSFLREFSLRYERFELPVKCTAYLSHPWVHRARRGAGAGSRRWYRVPFQHLPAPARGRRSPWPARSPSRRASRSPLGQQGAPRFDWRKSLSKKMHAATRTSTNNTAYENSTATVRVSAVEALYKVACSRFSQRVGLSLQVVRGRDPGDHHHDRQGHQCQGAHPANESPSARCRTLPVRRRPSRTPRRTPCWLKA